LFDGGGQGFVDFRNRRFLLTSITTSTSDTSGVGTRTANVTRSSAPDDQPLQPQHRSWSAPSTWRRPVPVEDRNAENQAPLTPAQE
jgi:hypothetical protein